MQEIIKCPVPSPQSPVPSPQSPVPSPQSPVPVSPPIFSGSPIDVSAAADKKRVPIVFCADKNYGLYLPVAVQSIIENSSENYHYDIIVLDCGISREAIDVLQRQILPLSNFSLHVKDIETFLAKHNAAFEEKGYLTRAMYGRLFIPELCCCYDKVIYSDVDLIFNRDIADLMNIDLSNHYIAGVIDNGAITGMLYDKKIEKLLCGVVNPAAGEMYINSGLLVFNIDAWRDLNLSDKIIGLLGEKRFWLPDQDAINSICLGKILFLEHKWNCLPKKHFLHREKYFKNTSLKALRESLDDYEKAWLSDKTIFHFTGEDKPWNDISADKGDLWWKYAEKTESFPRYIRDLLSFSEKRRHEKKSLIQANYIRDYKFLGIPFLTVKESSKKKKYIFCGLRIAKNIYGKENIYLYILGLKLFSIKRKQV